MKAYTCIALLLCFFLACMTVSARSYNDEMLNSDRIARRPATFDKLSRLNKLINRIAKQIANEYLKEQTELADRDFLDNYFPGNYKGSGGYRCPSQNCGGMVCPRGFVYDSRGCKWCECR